MIKLNTCTCKKSKKTSRQKLNESGAFKYSIPLTIQKNITVARTKNQAPRELKEGIADTKSSTRTNRRISEIRSARNDIINGGLIKLELTIVIDVPFASAR